MFWGDERCVPPDHRESNFGNAYKALLSKIDFPDSHVHRIEGELEPAEAIKRYERVIQENIALGKRDIPVFDWLFLGLGSDGHIASIFPNSELNSYGSSICAASAHPQSGQKRITLQLEVINNARRISFLVTGKSKAEIVARVIKHAEKYSDYPATWVKPYEGTTEWYLDNTAAMLLET